MVSGFTSMECACLVTLLFVLAGWHWQAERDRLCLLGGRLCKALKERLSSPCRSWNSGAARTEDAEEAWVKQRLDEARLSHARHAAQAGAILNGLLYCVLIVVVGTAQDAKIIERYSRIGIVAILAHVSFTYVARDCTRVSLFGVKVFFVVVNVVYFARTALGGGIDVFFFLGHGTRTCLRALAGIMLLDFRLSSVVNTIWSVVLICYVLYVHGPPSFFEGPHDMKVFVASELLTLVTMQYLLWFVEDLVVSHIRLSAGMSVSENIQQTVRRLLSVLCDAELHLSSSLAIRDPSRKAAHLLAPDRGAEGVQSINGRPFADFIAGPDRFRFAEFLASAAAMDEQAAPVASLQMHLHDTTGRPFPAEVFHAQLPDSAGAPHSGHILGIREQGVRQEPAPSPAPMPAAPQVVQQPLAPAGINEAAVPTDDADAASSVGPSASLVSVATTLQSIDLPELQRIDVHFDPLSPGMPVKEFHVLFSSLGTPHSQPPELSYWVLEEARAPFVNWVQESINAWNFDLDRPQLPGPLLLQWPSQTNRGDDLVLSASSVALDMPELEEEEEDDDDDEDDEGEGAPRAGADDGEVEEASRAESWGGLVAVLRLQNFKQQCGQRGRHRRHASAVSARRSTRSHLSGKSHRSNLNQLKEEEPLDLPAGGTD